MSSSAEPRVPFSDPPYLSGIPSIYYKKTHLQFQKNVREYLEKNFLPNAARWEQAGQVPPEVFRSFCRDGLFLPTMVTPLPVSTLRNLGLDHVLGTPVEEIDDFHMLIFYDEIFRCGLAGPINSQTGGFSIVSPYIIRYASTELKERVLPHLLSGQKRWCIALTEPRGGSDIARVSTTATKSADGKHYIINGEKTLITGGTFSDMALVAVRTGAPSSGAAGLSMVIVPVKDYPGVTAERLYCCGQISVGSTHFRFKDVRVPVENRVGEEGMGFKYIVSGLNHERVALATGVARQARLALSLAYERSMKRETFGNLLVEKSVVRHKLAKATAELEALWSWLEHVCYQRLTIPEEEKETKIGPTAALIKAKAGMVFSECATTAILLHGGSGYLTTGEGEMVEKLYREVPGARIPGGSEDVLLDSAVKQLTKRGTARL